MQKKIAEASQVKQKGEDNSQIESQRDANSQVQRDREEVLQVQKKECEEDLLDLQDYQDCQDSEDSEDNPQVTEKCEGNLPELSRDDKLHNFEKIDEEHPAS